MELRGKTALVTGASGKIGFAIASALLEEGVNLCFHYHRNDSRISEIEAKAKKLNCNTKYVSLNLYGGDFSIQIKKLFDETLCLTGELHIMINCLGDFIQKPLIDIESQEFRAIINSNLNIAFDLTKRALLYIGKNTEGRIIHLGYATANQIEGKPSILPYHIAKMGLILLVKSFAQTEIRNNILINCISPGICTGSQFLPPSNQFSLEHQVEMCEITNAVNFILKSNNITGLNMEIDRGWRGFSDLFVQ